MRRRRPAGGAAGTQNRDRRADDHHPRGARSRRAAPGLRAGAAGRGDHMLFACLVLSRLELGLTWPAAGGILVAPAIRVVRLSIRDSGQLQDTRLQIQPAGVVAWQGRPQQGTWLAVSASAQVRNVLEGAPSMTTRAWLACSGRRRFFGCRAAARTRSRRGPGRSGRRHRPQPAPAGRAVSAAAVDPIAALIAASQQHFDAGERELEWATSSAPAPSSTAPSTSCSSPLTGPAPTPACASTSIAWSTASTRTRSPRSRQGDGFAEKKDEPASIDELLTIATFPKPAAGAADDRGRQGGPRGDRARHPDSAEREGAGVRRAVPGPAARLHPGEPDARHASTCR